MNSLAATPAPDTDPEIQHRLEESLARDEVNLRGHELALELGTALGLVAAGIAMVAALPARHGFDPALAAGLVVAYALAARAEFHAGAGWAFPTQIVFVPMLFLAPVPAVPLLVAAGYLTARAPEYVTGGIRPDRAIVQVANAWYAVGPAVVLSLAGGGVPDWGDWPVYLGALGSQYAFDFARATVRARFVFGVGFVPLLRELASAWVVDALLAPLGLVVAIASTGASWTFLAGLPLIALIAIFAREREARIANALTLGRAYRGTAHLLAEVLTATHEYTGDHSRSVVVLAHDVSVALGLDERTMREVEFGALLHDIGKMSVPAEILNKPGSLSDDEWRVMQTHTAEGERMLARIGGVLAEVGHVVRSHHERWDGRGYPDGLRGDEIPLAARIICACDAFNAMTTDRSYRLAMPSGEAIAELRRHAGSQFDPRVVDALVGVVERAAAVARERALEPVAA